MRRQKMRDSGRHAGQRASPPKARQGSPEAASGHPKNLLSYIGRHGWIFGLFLLAATLLAYLPVWHAGFIWDDDLLCTNNRLIKSPHGWFLLWTTTKTPDYYPVMASCFWVEWRLWAMNAAGYHVVNVLLHAANAILFWRVLARLNIPGARLAAAIFALHPVNAESVAWIAQLKNTLSLFFFVLSLWWYLKFDDTGRRRFYGLALGAFLLALWSKIEVAPLPFVLLGTAWWRRGRVTGKDFQRSAPFFAAAFVLGLVSVWFQYHVAIGHDVVRADSFWSRLAGAGWVVWFYLGKTLLPLGLTPVYPRWQIDAANALSYVPGLLVAAGLVWMARFFEWQNIFLKSPFCALLLAVLGALTWRAASVYHSPETLWQTALERDPQCWLASENLGDILLKKGKPDEAIAELRQTLAINPADGVAYNNIGNALLQKGEVDAALTNYERAVAVQPDFAFGHYNLGNLLLQTGRVDEGIAQLRQVVAILPEFVEAHNNLGNVLLQRGETDEAMGHFQQAVDFQPDYAAAHYNLGTALMQKGRVDEAMVHFQRAIAIQPDYAKAHNNLGVALAQKGQLDEAIVQIRKALEIQPGLVDAQVTLGQIAWVLATSPNPSLRNGTKAVELAQQTDQLSGGSNPVMAATLAAAYAEAGRFPDAVTTAQRAGQLAASQNNQPLVASLERQLKLYQAGLPFRDSGAAR